ncbi:MAG: hypothetical protein ACYC9O_15655 [Candidatus Latescibacterota bacterium]
MFKKITVGLAAVGLAVLLAVPVQAQLTMQPVEFDVNLGLALPMGDLGDVSGTGFSIGADGFLWTFDSVPELKLGGRVAYNKFGEEDFGPGVSSSASIIEIVPSVRYMLPSSGNIGFFGQAGVGLFLKSVSAETPFGDADDSETDLGITVGGGVTFAAGGVNLVAMPLLHLTGDNYFTLSIGALFGGE